MFHIQILFFCRKIRLNRNLKKEGTSMENKIQLFKFEGKEVRTLKIDGEPWFVGKDVATILGYKRLQKAVQDHVDPEDKFEKIVNISQASQNGTRAELTLLTNESGVYSLIFGSQLLVSKLVAELMELQR